MQTITAIREAFSIKELRDKILATLLLLVVYRLGAQLTLPGIDPNVIGSLQNATGQGLLGLLDAFTGGAFSRVSLFALGIMPYISASIIVQLGGVVIPYFQKLQKEGESGREKINQISRWLTVAICLIQSPAYLASLSSLGIPDEAFIFGRGGIFWVSSVALLLTGTVFAMWLGERITERGIGNGISLLIMVGIIARLPQAFLQEFFSRVSQARGGLIVFLLEILLWMFVVLLSIFMVEGVRRIAVQYARKDMGSAAATSARQYIPLKINATGVMPIIFAQALMFLPSFLFGLSDSDFSQQMKIQFSDVFSLPYNILFCVMILLFSFFYTAIALPSEKIADDLKRSGGFVPGIKPGRDTSNFIDAIMSRITLFGAIFLCFLAIIPSIVFKFAGVQQSCALFFGGTSLLILVGVAMDTSQQIKSYLLNRKYGGLVQRSESSLRTKLKEEIEIV